MAVSVRRAVIAPSANEMGSPLIVIVLAYCGLKGIIYLKKDSSVGVAPQFHLGRVALLPLSNHRCPISEKGLEAGFARAFVHFNSTTALVHPCGHLLWVKSTQIEILFSNVEDN